MSTRKPLEVSARSTSSPRSSPSQRCRDSAPRCFATTSQASPSSSSSGSQRDSIAWSSALPTRIGGFDQIVANRSPAGTSSGSTALTLSRPSRVALCRTRSRARSFTSTAHTAASGDCSARLTAMGPQPVPRSRRSPDEGGSGTVSSSTRVPSSRWSGLNTPPAVVSSTSRPASTARMVRVLRSLRGDEEK